MKLLSISYISHDSNICYYDGEKLKYFKSERQLQEKHHKIPTLEDCESLMGLKIDDMDQVCFCTYYRGEPVKTRIVSDKISQIDHHYAHVLSVSLFEGKPDVSIVIDGQGGENCWVVYRDDQLIDSGKVEKVGSIGYGMFILAKELNIQGHLIDTPGKLMGLQSYGNIDVEFLKFIQKYNINNVGSTRDQRIRIQGTPVSYNHNGGLFSFEHWKKHKGELAEETKLDWLRTVHERCGEIILDFFKVHAKPDDVIHYSGGVAQNIIWNTLLKKHFKNLVILPHSSDEGISLGAMEFLRIKNDLPPFKIDNFPYIQSDELTDDPNDDTIYETAKLLAEGKIVAYYQGNGEIGPRALGNRSILMDPRIPNGKDIMNKVKNREYYRPFGASILSEYAKEYFDLDFANPYMLYVGVTQKDNLESITHVDGTCRVQTVTTGHFRKLLQHFYELTGCPVLMNTSLNVSGKPIAGHISDAMNEFNSKNIDVLVVGNEIYRK